MTQAADLLKTYRTSIVTDHISFQMVSVLYRDGRKSEKSLLEAIDVPGHRIRSELVSLYKANWLVIDSDQFELTNMARFVLRRLHVSDDVARWFTRRLELDDDDSRFLQGVICAWPDWRPDQDVLVDTWLALLRSLDRISTKWERWSKRVAPIDKRRAVYALILGTHPVARSLRPEQFIERVRIWSSQAEDEDHHGEWTLSPTSGGRLADAVSQALKDFESSERCLQGDLDSQTGPWSEAARTTAYVRILSAVLERVADPVLTVRHDKPEGVMRHWDWCQEWRADSVHDAFQLFAEVRGRKTLETGADTLQVLQEQLESVLGRIQTPLFTVAAYDTARTHVAVGHDRTEPVPVRGLRGVMLRLLTALVRLVERAGSS